MEAEQQNVTTKKSSRKFVVIGVIIVILLVFSVPLFLLSQKSNTSLSSDSTNQSTSDSEIDRSKTSFTLSPSQADVGVGETFDVTISVNSKKNILATDVYVRFDPDYVEIVGVQPETVFEDPMTLTEQIDNETGTLIYSLASLTPSQTKGPLMNISLRAKKPVTGTRIELSENTLVSVSGAEQAETVIVSASTITIK